MANVLDCDIVLTEFELESNQRKPIGVEHLTNFEQELNLFSFIKYLRLGLALKCLHKIFFRYSFEIRQKRNWISNPMIMNWAWIKINFCEWIRIKFCEWIEINVWEWINIKTGSIEVGEYLK